MFQQEICDSNISIFVYRTYDHILKEQVSAIFLERSTNLIFSNLEDSFSIQSEHIFQILVGVRSVHVLRQRYESLISHA